MKKKWPPAAPQHLSEGAAAFWREITEKYVLEAHEVRLLQMACECLDRAEAARQAIAKDGSFVTGGRGALVAHPGIKVQKDSQDQFRLLLGKLDLKHVTP